MSDVVKGLVAVSTHPLDNNDDLIYAHVEFPRTMQPDIVKAGLWTGL